MKYPIFILFFCLIGLAACKETPKSPPKDPIAGEPMSEVQASPEVKVIPIEHATAVIEWGDTTIYIDPVGGAEAFESQKKPDLILVTDIHQDHLSVETLQALKMDSTKIIVPQAVADQMPDALKTQLEILNNGEVTTLGEINISAIPMYNLRPEAREFHTKGRGNGYVIGLGDKRIYFSGDTEDIPEMRELKDIDMAFICMNLPYTMTVESAADAVIAFRPEQVYPYHYRGNPDVGDVRKFASLVTAADKNIEIIQLDWYPGADY